MEINIRIASADVEKCEDAKIEIDMARVNKLVQVNQDVEFLCGIFCDNYCKFPDGHISNEALERICDGCPMNLIVGKDKE